MPFSRAICSRCSVTNGLSFAAPLDSFPTGASSSGRGWPGRSIGGDTRSLTRTAPCRVKKTHYTTGVFVPAAGTRFLVFEPETSDADFLAPQEPVGVLGPYTGQWV